MYKVYNDMTEIVNSAVILPYSPVGTDHGK